MTEWRQIPETSKLENEALWIWLRAGLDSCFVNDLPEIGQRPELDQLPGERLRVRRATEEALPTVRVGPDEASKASEGFGRKMSRFWQVC
jgi:hypothetical protein